MSLIKLAMMFFVATSLLKAIKETQQKNMVLAYNKGFSQGTITSNSTRRKR